MLLHDTGPGESEMLFAGPQFESEQRDAPQSNHYAGEPQTELFAPFSESFDGGNESEVDEQERLELEALVDELRDEAFDESMEALADEVSARHLAAIGSWSSELEAPAMAGSEAESWMASLASEADRLLEMLEAEFRDRTAESLREGELEASAAAHLASSLGGAGEAFLGSIVRKVGRLARGAVNLAKKGIKSIGKLLPLRKLFALLRRLVRPLLARVLRFAIGKLPVAVRPIATTLASRLTGEPEYEGTPLGLAEQFDYQLAEALRSPSEDGSEHLVSEYEAMREMEGHDAGLALDAARSRFVSQLLEAPAGVAPTAEMEQFLPAVMAVLPLVRMGIGVVGRDRVVGFIANQIASLAAGYVGAEAANALARPLVDVGLRMLTLEAEAGARLGAEALASTVESTVRRVARLSAEALENDLRLATEVHQAFFESAAEHLGVADPAGESESERGVWVLMPRTTRPCYRYKRYTRMFRMPVSRPMARAIVFADGSTFEQRVLDAGVHAWPVQAEVELFETLPGTRLGHVAVGESANPTDVREELEELTPETAGLLLARPGLGRAGGAPTWSGGVRLMRVRVGGVPLRRWRRFSVRLDATRHSPSLGVHVRLTEREARVLSQLVSQRKAMAAVAGLRGVLACPARRALAAALVRRFSRTFPTPMTDLRAHQLANHLADAMITAFAADFALLGAQVVHQASDPRRGITLMFEFPFATRAALTGGSPSKPAVSVIAGVGRG